jgi:hypothetical protein
MQLRKKELKKTKKKQELANVTELQFFPAHSTVRFKCIQVNIRRVIRQGMLAE